MSAPVMRSNTDSVKAFIDAIDHDRKRAEAYQLLQIFEEVTQLPATMWGPSIIGFGSYHYKYDSGHEGDSPLVAFSPRKAKISLYLGYESEERQAFVDKIGKVSKSKACIYVNKLADIDLGVLRELIKFTFDKYQALNQ